MREFVPGEPRDLVLVSDEVCPPRLRVLVADDDGSDRLLTIQHLGLAWPVERDILVECSENGWDALEMIRRRQFGLVVLDANMPDLGGTSVLRSMRADGLRVPVVVVVDEICETLAGDLESMAAAFVSKNFLDPISFGSAIVESIHLQLLAGRL